MERKTLNFVILRVIRLIFLIIAIALIATGAGVWAVSPQVWGEAPYLDFSITLWRLFHLSGQYFPLITAVVVLVITAGLLAIFLSRSNLQLQYRQGILVLNIICAVVILAAACLESWYAAGAGVTLYDTYQVKYWKVVRVNGWIAAVVFLLLTLIDLIIDVILTRQP